MSCHPAIAVDERQLALVVPVETRAVVVVLLPFPVLLIPPIGVIDRLDEHLRHSPQRLTLVARELGPIEGSRFRSPGGCGVDIGCPAVP